MPDERRAAAKPAAPLGAGPVDVAAYKAAHGLDTLVTASAPNREPGVFDSVDPQNREPYPPEWNDLVRLHKLVRERKVTTILEFGVGWSTLVMADALERNQGDYEAKVRESLRRSNCFELHSLDDDPAFIDLTRARLPPGLAGRVHLHYSPCDMGTFNGRICTFYRSLPNICPDLVYVDGPSQFSVHGDVRGISTRYPDRLPMSADILAIEHFLLPGTLIVVDGRSANARFLRANLQRSWCYFHEPAEDVHFFELREPPLGTHNRRQIEFCLGRDWLDGMCE